MVKLENHENFVDDTDRKFVHRLDLYKGGFQPDLLANDAAVAQSVRPQAACMEI